MANNTDNTPERSAESIEARRKRREEMRRRHKQRQMLFYGGILVVLILIIVLIVRGCSSGDSTPENSTPPSDSGTVLQLPTPRPDDTDVNAPSGDENTPAADTTTVTITAVGDIMVYAEQLSSAMQTDGTYDFSGSFADISQYTLAGDLTVGNLETTLSGADVSGGYQGRPEFNSPESLAQNLADIGFDVLSTANTYSLQHGITGLVSTMRNIRQAAISNVGTYYTAEDRQKDGGALICEVDGINIAVLAYTKGANAMQVPAGYEYSVNFLYKDYYTNYSILDTETILADLTAVKALDVDIIIFMAHWGEEWSSTPNASQTELANTLFENGVDIIIGSHSHVLQPIEKRTIKTVDGEDKEVFVCYSLGNFIANHDRTYAQDSLILNLKLVRDNATGKVTVGDYDYVPVYIGGQAESFRLYDINQAIADYNAGNRYITDELYSKLRDSLNEIHTLVGADRDRGILTEYTASNSSIGNNDIDVPPSQTDGDELDTTPDNTTNPDDVPTE